MSVSPKYHNVSLVLLFQVVDQLQSGGTSSKNNLRAELPTVGLSEQVIKDLETLKAKDVDWQGKCSGTVYVFLFLTNNTLELAAHHVSIMFVNSSMLLSKYWVSFCADILLEVSLRATLN